MNIDKALHNCVQYSFHFVHTVHMYVTCLSQLWTKPQRNYIFMINKAKAKRSHIIDYLGKL